jgi:hypothetical protein
MKVMIHTTNSKEWNRRYSLTFGKSYYVTESKWEMSILIVLCDDGIYRSIHQSHFITHQEWREEQLNKLNIWT